MPGVSPDEAQEVLGRGPGLFLFNTSQLPNRKFVAMVKRVAAERKIPLQLELVLGYGDDSAEIQKSRGGVPTVCIVIPTRYTHAHNGIINRDDFDRTVELLVALQGAGPGRGGADPRFPARVATVPDRGRTSLLTRGPGFRDPGGGNFSGSRGAVPLDRNLALPEITRGLASGECCRRNDFASWALRNRPGIESARIEPRFPECN